jgi:hypothetical protein
MLSEHPLGTNAYQQEIDPRNKRMETTPNNVRDCSIHMSQSELSGKSYEGTLASMGKNCSDSFLFSAKGH